MKSPIIPAPKISTFTDNVVRQMLKQLAGNKQLSREILHSPLLGYLSDGTSDEQRGQELEKLLDQIAKDALEKQREHARILPTQDWPTSRTELIKTVIERDFSSIKGGYSTDLLCAWSTLYHRFLAPCKFSSQQIAEITQISPRNPASGARQVNRCLDVAVKELT